MTPLPFALPQIISLQKLRDRGDVRVIELYDRRPADSVRAAVIRSIESQPQLPCLVAAEIESDGLTADGWEPLAVLKLMEGVGASALVFSISGDDAALAEILPQLLPHAHIPVGAMISHGMEHVLPLLPALPLLLSPDRKGAALLEQEARRIGCFDTPLPRYDDGEEALISVTGGRVHYVDAAIDIDAECDISRDDVIFERWLLDQEEVNWGAVRVLINAEDELRIFDENQYMIKMPLALASDDPEMFSRAVRHFCGIAMYDGTCDLDQELLNKLHRKYGLLLL